MVTTRSAKVPSNAISLACVREHSCVFACQRYQRFARRDRGHVRGSWYTWIEVDAIRRRILCFINQAHLNVVELSRVSRYKSHTSSLLHKCSGHDSAMYRILFAFLLLTSANERTFSQAKAAPRPTIPVAPRIAMRAIFMGFSLQPQVRAFVYGVNLDEG